MLLLTIAQYVVGFLFLVMLVSVIIGVPCLPTHAKEAKKMIAWAELKPGMKVIDLGSGAGRLLFLAAAKGAHATGYELNPFLVLWSRLVARIKGMSDRVEVKWKSLYGADLKEMDAVFAFLFPKPMKRLGPKLFNEMQPGSVIISYAFSIPEHEPERTEQGIMLYRVERL